MTQGHGDGERCWPPSCFLPSKVREPDYCMLWAHSYWTSSLFSGRGVVRGCVRHCPLKEGVGQVSLNPSQYYLLMMSCWNRPIGHHHRRHHHHRHRHLHSKSTLKKKIMNNCHNNKADFLEFNQSKMNLVIFVIIITICAARWFIIFIIRVWRICFLIIFIRVRRVLLETKSHTSLKLSLYVCITVFACVHTHTINKIN